jgi:CRISPR-associated protein Cas2
MIVIVAYDITDDHRREDVAMLLSGYGHAYPTATQTFAERYIIGARTVEERADYWIVR